MASKRTINRAYWVATKVCSQPSANIATKPRVLALLADCLEGQPDRLMLPKVETWESIVGTHKPTRDLADSTLWDGRKDADTVINAHRY